MGGQTGSGALRAFTDGRGRAGRRALSCPTTDTAQPQPPRSGQGYAEGVYHIGPVMFHARRTTPSPFHPHCMPGRETGEIGLPPLRGGWGGRGAGTREAGASKPPPGTELNKIFCFVVTPVRRPLANPTKHKFCCSSGLPASVHSPPRGHSIRPAALWRDTFTAPGTCPSAPPPA